MEDWIPQWEKHLLASSVERIKRSFTGTTCVTRAMSTPVGVNDGFVSNDSDSEIRETSAHETSAHASANGAELVSNVRDFSYRKHQVVERDYSQLSGRTLNDPSAPEPRVPGHLPNSTSNGS